MSVIVFLATIAKILANPPAAYVQEMSAPVRAAYEAHRNDSGAKVISALDELVASGDMSAAEFAGEVFARGALGVGRDMKRACDYFEVASAHRPDAAHNFGTCLYKGQGRAQDLSAARDWYASASQGGWVKAHCALGNMLIGAQGGESDLAGGIALCRLSAELGDADAQTDLGGYLLVGEAVERDPIEARRWLEQAARQQHANAAYLLAQIYWNGDGIDKDGAVARQWWEVAHERGRPDAAFRIVQTILARMAANPEAPDRSFLPDAIAWAEIAAEREPDSGRRSQAAELLASFKRLEAGRDQ